MVNQDYFRVIKSAAESDVFLSVTDLSDTQTEKQRHVEMAVRLLVHTYIDYDGTLDVGEYTDDGILNLAKVGDSEKAKKTISATMKLLHDAAGSDALRRFDGTTYVGRVGLVGLESIAVGVAKNLAEIEKLDDPAQFVKVKSQSFWSQEQVSSFVSPGMRGTTRIQKTIPFGSKWFNP